MLLTEWYETNVTATTTPRTKLAKMKIGELFDDTYDSNNRKLI